MLNIVITAGGTSEPIDNVRKITNSSTGKLGAVIAEELLKREDVGKIFYIKAKKAMTPPLGVYVVNENKKLEIIEIESTFDLKAAVEKVLMENKINYFIHSMAVSDYYVDYVSTAELLNEALKGTEDFVEALKNPQNKLEKQNKISSNQDNLVVMLRQTPKIINMIKKISPATHLFGFKLLDGVSEEELINVATKLKEKNNCDYVIANDLAKIREGNHEALIIGNNIEKAYGKKDIAKKISERIQ